MKVGISTESVIGHAAALGRDLKSVLGEPLGEYTPEDLKLYLRKRFSDKIRTDVDRDAWGYLISFVGNRARWSATQCRFIVFETLAWLAELAQVPDYFSGSAVLPNPSASARLQAYRGQAMAQNGYIGRSGPTLTLGDPRTIAVRNKTRYPNVTQVRKTGNPQSYMPKEVTMRYSEDPALPPELLFVPEFFAVRGTTRGSSSWRVEPEMRNLNGRQAKFSLCMLAEQIQCLVVEAIALHIGAEDTASEASTTDLFDLFNLIYRKSYEFYLVDRARKFDNVKRLTLYGEPEPLASSLIPIEELSTTQLRLL